MFHILAGMVCSQAFWQAAVSILINFLSTITSKRTTRAYHAGNRQAAPSMYNFIVLHSRHLHSRYLSVCKQLAAGASVSITVQPCLWQLQVLRNKKIFTNPDSMNNGCGSATDGDLDAAYALLLAGQKWHDPLYTERGIKARSKHVVKHASCTGQWSFI